MQLVRGLHSYAASKPRSSSANKLYASAMRKVTYTASCFYECICGVRAVASGVRRQSKQQTGDWRLQTSDCGLQQSLKRARSSRPLDERVYGDNGRASQIEARARESSRKSVQKRDRNSSADANARAQYFTSSNRAQTQRERERERERELELELDMGSAAALAREPSFGARSDA